jgi:hypothetical protein
MLGKFIKISVIIGVGMAILPVISLAQMNLNMSSTLSSELGVEIVPNYPRPNETVFINLSLYTDDLNSANITWYNNGKNVLSGKGETRYSFTTGPIGTESKIEIRVSLLSGVSFSKIINLNPASVDLIWEADSYVPPFYKGKALHPMQGSLKVAAMPEFIKNGRRISASNLVYQWSNGINVYQSQSGYGKSTIILNGSILGRSENMEVLVTDPVNNLVAQGFVNISPIDPEIVFYENSPYYGHLFDSAVTGTLNLKTEEIQILVAPYYFSKESAGGLKYEWRLNSQIIPDLSGSRTAIFRKPEEETGQSVISLRIENINRILQQANNDLTMNFEK